jgi:hypothetical protein
MGERKVLVRYIPPDFDPSIIPKFKRDKSKLCEVRTMIPFSMRCSTCGEYMGRGKKFNSKKEMCEGESYMGIRRFRFIIKCAVCSAQISFKTDPKASDYEMEYGATRNYEVWKDNETAQEEDQKAQEEEEEMDAMKALENRTLDSKNEMDILDALDETMAINRRHQRIDTDAILTQRASAQAASTSGLTAEDEGALQAFRESRKRKQEDVPVVAAEAAVSAAVSAAGGSTSGPVSVTARIAQQVAKASEDSKKPAAATVILKKRKIDKSGEDKDSKSAAAGSKQAGSAAPVPAPVPAPAPAPAAPSMFAAYGSSSDDE